MTTRTAPASSSRANALAGGVHTDEGWDNIEEAFATWGYLGLTVLRMNDVASGTGQRRYAEFIAEYGPDV